MIPNNVIIPIAPHMVLNKEHGSRRLLESIECAKVDEESINHDLILLGR